MADDKTYDPEAIAEEVEEMERECWESVDTGDIDGWEQPNDDE